MNGLDWRDSRSTVRATQQRLVWNFDCASAPSIFPNVLRSRDEKNSRKEQPMASIRWAIFGAGIVLSAATVSQTAAPAATAVARGIAALHDFEYEEANAAFLEARSIDPGSVIACWGEAMTYHQTLWRNENVDAGRQALARLAPTAAERAAKASGAKEQRLLAAVERLFGAGDASTRRREYADAMARAHDALPEDPDIASLYALALLGTVSRSLIGTGDAHDSALAGSDVQRQVGALLTHVLAGYPRHPGALHYLIHNYDDPAHARLALAAARTYATVAGESSHARHMPAHIFLQLGLWHDAAAADRASFDASTAWVKRRGFGPALRNYHALSWLQYELLQLGRYREAATLLDEIKPVADADPSHRLLSDLSSMRGRYTIETRRWETMARETNFGNVDELFAIGMSAARIGNRDLAERARATLADRSRAEAEGDLRPAIAIMEREVAATMALAAGRRDEGMGILQMATDAELQLPAPLGLPHPIKPAPELLGEVLLDAGRFAEAQKAFEQALRRNANRSLSLLGLARATTAAGQPAAARKHYQQLLANFDRADADVVEVKEARAALRAPGR
jgi:tetratricopeptide (TPR) repeat protein